VRAPYFLDSNTFLPALEAINVQFVVANTNRSYRFLYPDAAVHHPYHQQVKSLVIENQWVI
jgi:hypothetical protein